MTRPTFFACILSVVCAAAAHAADLDADWPQAAGPRGDFQTSQPAAVQWSVALDQHIAWKITLPETGQSTPVIRGDLLFFTTLKPVKSDAKLGSDLVAWCCDARTGRVLWQRDIPGKYPLRLSGCFSDSSSPPAMCDGQRVVFVNASGTIACFDLEGKPLWSREILTAGRTLPFMTGGNVVVTHQVYPPDDEGEFTPKYADAPPEMWTQLEALDMASGDVVWTSRCGVNMGCAILPQKLSDGRDVAVVGRGGGHGPPEKPEGVSMIDLRDGSTVWTLPLEDFMATMSFSIRRDEAHLFHKGEHLSIDALTGKIVRRVSILSDIPVNRWIDGRRVTRTETLPETSARMITQTSNLLVGPYHYFRSYTHPYLGRVNVDTGAVEYLELPLQLVREPGSPDKLHWYPWASVPTKGKRPPLQSQSLVPNDVKNSAGFVVMGDKRSVGNGWGHIAAPTPSVAGEYLYIPVMNGTVYVIRCSAERLDETAIAAINDLGPAGRSYTRASLSFAHGRIYAHTIRELICIGD